MDIEQSDDKLNENANSTLDNILPTSNEEEMKNLMKDLEADSLDAVEIIMAIEDEYDIEIPDEDAERFQTVSDLVNYIEAKA